MIFVYGSNGSSNIARNNRYFWSATWPWICLSDVWNPGRLQFKLHLATIASNADYSLHQLAALPQKKRSKRVAWRWVLWQFTNFVRISPPCGNNKNYHRLCHRLWAWEQFQLMLVIQLVCLHGIFGLLIQKNYHNVQNNFKGITSDFCSNIFNLVNIPQSYCTNYSKLRTVTDSLNRTFIRHMMVEAWLLSAVSLLYL